MGKVMSRQVVYYLCRSLKHLCITVGFLSDVQCMAETSETILQLVEVHWFVILHHHVKSLEQMQSSPKHNLAMNPKGELVYNKSWWFFFTRSWLMEEQCDIGYELTAKTVGEQLDPTSNRMNEQEKRRKRERMEGITAICKWEGWLGWVNEDKVLWGRKKNNYISNIQSSF